MVRIHFDGDDLGALLDDLERLSPASKETLRRALFAVAGEAIQQLGGHAAAAPEETASEPTLRQFASLMFQPGVVENLDDADGGKVGGVVTISFGPPEQGGDGNP